MHHLFWGILLAVLSLVSFLSVFIPAYLIRPFVAQTQRGVEISYLLRGWSPTLTLLLLLVAAPPAILLGRAKLSRLARVAIGLAALVLIGSAIMARQNHFEWMFRPAPPPGYVEVGKASHVKEGDMLLAVEHKGRARAYPVRMMAYHHLLNDVIAGEPIVVTY